MPLPPLKSLPVFESAARLNSFSKAAAELNITQGAVSHTIKSLESHLGEQLFLRQGKQLTLTNGGKTYLEEISLALLQIEKATDQLKGHKSNRFRIAVYSSFAVYWLVPRLADFQRQHPQIDLSVEMMSLDPELSNRVGDCFITIDKSHQDFSFEHLYKERLFAVCSPRFYNQMAVELRKFTSQDIDSYLAQNPDWLAQFPLITAHSIFGKYSEDWYLWFQTTGIALPSQAKLYDFSHLMLAKEAAVHHQGIALINDYMLQKSEYSNKLVKLPCHSLDTGSNFYFAYKTSRRNDPELLNIKRWLQQQSKELTKE